jgi:hypothetical protein
MTLASTLFPKFSWVLVLQQVVLALRDGAFLQAGLEPMSDMSLAGERNLVSSVCDNYIWVPYIWYIWYIWPGGIFWEGLNLCPFLHGILGPAVRGAKPEAGGVSAHTEEFCDTRHAARRSAAHGVYDGLGVSLHLYQPEWRGRRRQRQQRQWRSGNTTSE